MNDLSVRPAAGSIARFLAASIAAVLVALLMLPLPTHADEILVSAASSLTDALAQIGAAYTKDHPGTEVRFNFAASGILQKQIEQGAPVDVFASASPKEMDALQKASKIDTATRINFAGNRLVLIAPLGGKIRDWGDLTGPSIRHVAISQPATVPSGRYAQETLTRRGSWTALQPRLVFGGNVRQTLSYVADSNADAGIVFSTDARVEKRVKVVAIAIPGKDHDPIVYPAAVVVGAPNSTGAHGFVQFLTTPTARKILAGFGFAIEKAAAKK